MSITNRLLRTLAFVAMLIALPGAVPQAGANGWPAQPVHLVLPYPPGGASDVTARLLAEHLTARWSQSVVVDNRPGANGIIANEAVAVAARDGYTVLMANLGPNAINPAVYRKLPYDTQRDFAAVILTTKVPLIIVTAPNSPIRDLRQLIELARAKPRTVTFGSAGNGAGSHLAGELLNELTGVKMMHIPYKGDAPSLTDVMGGQITVALPTVLAGAPHVRSGKMRALAVTSRTRIPSLPDVPTVQEALGLQDFEAVSWGGFMVPSGTPAPVITRINEDINAVLRMPAVVSKIESQGAQIVGGTPAEFAVFLRSELAKWKDVAVKANVRLD